RSNMSHQFLRPVSGLVKSLRAWDVLVYNIGIISFGLGAIYTQKYATAYYPSGDISLSTVFAGVIMFFTVLGLLAWTTVVPRSGGIYVFVSRSGLPWFGFSLSFVEAVSWVFYVAVAARELVVAILVPSLFLLFGADSVLVLWVSGSSGQFCIATLLIII